MRNLKKLALCSVVLASAAAAEDYVPPVVGGHTWVQHQVEAAKARHPLVQAIIVTGAHDKTHENVVLGSTLGAASVFSKVDKGSDDGAALSANGRQFVVREALVSSSNHRLGTIEVRFAGARGASTKALSAIAAQIQAELKLGTLSSKNAIDPWPYDTHFGTNTFAQQLNERITRAHPDVLVMMIHATKPGGAPDKANFVIGSNIGRFGKLADEDDLRVIEQGSTNLEVGGDNDRFETELPLLDAKGTRIGALGLVFSLKEGQDHEAIHKHGIAIRDELARMIPSVAALFAPRHKH